MNNPTVELISECFVRPRHVSVEALSPIHLSPWDIAMLSLNYIQKGLLFVKPRDDEFTMDNLLRELKDSLSSTLTHFYPLAARLATMKQDDPPSCAVYLHLKDSPGAKFIHATANMHVSDVFLPTDVPEVVRSFFDHNEAVNHDGHVCSLLSVKVTELIDGVFIGFTVNHTVCDGTSFWHFINTWSEVFGAKERDDSHSISRPPVHKRWVLAGCDPIISLPFMHPEQFISRPCIPPSLRERFFHLSSESISKLKARANSECDTTKISSLQAVSALVWRCVTRARRLPLDGDTCCKMAVNNRSRLVPPLSNDYFGNPMQVLRTSVRTGELLEHGIGWAALRLHEMVANYDDKAVQEWVEKWMKCPVIYRLDQLVDGRSVAMTSSPKFNMYGTEFGLGKAVAVRSGGATKFDGKVTLYPGAEGGGSMDLEVSLLPEYMKALESDEEFISLLSRSS